MADSADRFLSLVSQPGQFLGGQTEVRRRQRAFALIFNGDLSLLREETVEPLQVIGILPHAERYLPASLRSRVQTVVFNSELRFGEWRAKIRFVTEDPDSAVQVGNIVAAWRDLAGSLADRFAGYSSGQRLREALQTATVQVSGDEVTAAGIIPAAAVVRVAKEAAGHGGGCPPGTPCALNKVAICHLTSSGHGGHTICVTPSAVSAHLAHGDTCGPCAEEAATVEPDPSSSR